MSTGKSIRLFLVNGSPGGLLTAEIVNWTGQITSSPRSDLGELTKRPDAARTGVYILLGDDSVNVGNLRAYIGEADIVSLRLQQHARPEKKGGKDFWERAVVLTSKDANLTKAHARYLEARLISMAREAGRSKLDNGTAPDLPRLPEADISDMEDFLQQAKIVLPILGVNIFRSSKVTATKNPSASAADGEIETSPTFVLESAKYGYRATARIIDGEFTLLEGSTARVSWVGIASGYRDLRRILEQDGVIISSASGAKAKFVRDYVFNSPSAAAAIVAGRSSNGRQAWRVLGSGASYAEWQEQEFMKETGIPLGSSASPSGPTEF